MSNGQDNKEKGFGASLKAGAVNLFADFRRGAAALPGDVARLLRLRRGDGPDTDTDPDTDNATEKAAEKPPHNQRAARRRLWGSFAGAASSLFFLGAIGGLGLAFVVMAPRIADDADLWNVNRQAAIVVLDRNGEEIAARGARYGEQVEPEDPDPAESENADLGSDAVTELGWDALIPAEWQPDKIMEQFNAEELEDDDPRAQELLNRLLALWKESPVVEDLDGKRVKLPGFVVPLDTDGQKIREFLLVPYYGACIHVPPPPANQTVHVVTGTDRKYQGGLFDPVWVSGILKVEASTSDLAEAGYRMDAIEVEPYE